MRVRGYSTRSAREACRSGPCEVDAAGNGTVTEQRLSQLIRQPGPIADRQFEIAFLDPGVKAFAFTFG
jgi:Thioredoxin like C-terminal domain